MSDDARERVAKALFDMDHQQEWAMPWSIMGPNIREQYARRADRILEALRAAPEVGRGATAAGEGVAGDFGYGAGGVPAPEVCVMGLCETAHVLLQPRAYRFVVMPGCAKCEEMARVATDMPEGGTRTPWATTSTTTPVTTSTTTPDTPSHAQPPAPAESEEPEGWMHVLDMGVKAALGLLANSDMGPMDRATVATILTRCFDAYRAAHPERPPVAASTLIHEDVKPPAWDLTTEERRSGTERREGRDICGSTVQHGGFGMYVCLQPPGGHHTHGMDKALSNWRHRSRADRRQQREPSK